MTPDLVEVFTAQGGVATSPQILQHISFGAMQRYLRHNELMKVWPNVYSCSEPDMQTRLNGLDLLCGKPVAICLGTAAALFDFDTQGVTALHVLNPDGHQLRSRSGLVVHRRHGAQLTMLRGRPITTPAWTAVEVARALPRPRALATLDAALRSGTCDRDELLAAATQQAGRKNIVTVRKLIPLARPQAESPMESETRLVMHDGGLPEPELQYEVIDRDGRLWRLDFAWPDRMVAVEYDGFDWHSSAEHLRRDRQKRAALQELRWRTIYVVSDDVRKRQVEMLRRIDVQLQRPAA